MPATVAQCVIPVDHRSTQIIAGRPRLAWLLRELTRFGVTEFLLLTDSEPLDPAAIRLPRPARVTLARTTAEAGSGGALFHVRDQLQDHFLLCDGHTLLDWNLATLLAEAASDEPTVIGRHAQTSGPAPTDPARITLFRHALIEHLRPACSLDTDILPGLAAQGCLRESLVTPTGNPQRHRPNRHRNALFLDRDGVLNVDHGYVGTQDRFDWTHGALDAIRHATQAGWHVFIVTNQSGVARGHYTQDAVRHLLDWIADQARAAGGTIDDARFCPYHPQASVAAYRQDHPWRKPRPGMLLDLIEAWELDPERAVMVGDQATDMQAAAAAGVAGHLFQGGNLHTFLAPILDRH